MGWKTVSSPSERPTTRTYSGGGELPALTDQFQRVPIGRTPTGTYAPEQRAFLVSVANRSRDTIEVREGGGDAVEIGPYEVYKITDLSGRNYVELRGEAVGTAYEIKSVEAHNEFSFSDKLEAFVQSVSMLFETSGQIIQKSSELGVGDDGTYELRPNPSIDGGTETHTARLESPAGKLFEHRAVEYRVETVVDDTYKTNNEDAMTFQISGETGGGVSVFEAVWETDPQRADKYLKWEYGDWQRSDSRGTLSTSSSPGGWRLGRNDELVIDYVMSADDTILNDRFSDLECESDWRYDSIDV
jgi:hypothetical protein